jgi:hypothetical protein
MSQPTSDTNKVIGTVVIDDGTGQIVSDSKKLMGILQVYDGTGQATSDTNKLIGRIRTPTGGETQTSDAQKILGRVKIDNGTAQKTSDSNKVIGTYSLVNVDGSAYNPNPPSPPVFTPVLPTPSGAPTGWGSVVFLNGIEIHWNSSNGWYDESWNPTGPGSSFGIFVQPAYGGPTWLAEFNDDSNGASGLIQQYFTPGPNGTLTWLAPVISFYPWGAAAGVPDGGMYLNYNSGLSFGYKLGRYFPSDIPFAPDGPLTSYAGGFTP